MRGFPRHIARRLASCDWIEANTSHTIHRGNWPFPTYYDRAIIDLVIERVRLSKRSTVLYRRTLNL